MYKMKNYKILFYIFLLFLNNCSSNMLTNKTSADSENTSISKIILSGQFEDMQNDLSIDTKTDYDSKNKNSFLRLAVKNGNIDIVKEIIKSVDDINNKDSYGNTPLHYAIINNRLDVARFLINMGADINTINNDSQTPLHILALSIPCIHNTVPSMSPLNGSITSMFGIRPNPFNKNYQFHNGIDIGAPVDTPIRATADGTVIKHGWHGGLGNVIIIQHENGFETIYGHCKTIMVRSGSKVKKSQIIAYVGSTGASTGNHCHYEIHLNKFIVNPYPYLYQKNVIPQDQINEFIELLHKKNAQFNGCDKDGKSPLHYAVLRNQSMSGSLISHGTCINTQDLYGLSPLHYAVMMNNTDLARYLLKNGAKVNLKSKKKYTAVNGKYYSPLTTPLKIAMNNEWLPMSKLLIRYGGRE